MRATDPGAWRAWHLVYHGDRERLVRQVVHPIAVEALAAGDVSRFHFVHYTLGGPHVRLRLLPMPGREDAVAARVEEAAAAFFARFPSTNPDPEEAIRRRNRGIVASDPSGAGDEDLVYADNSVIAARVAFEVERYGGPALLSHSLDFFTLSSAEALRFLHLHGGAPVGRRMAEGFRLLARAAWGLAGDGADFVELAGFAVRLFGGNPLAGLTAPAEAAFARSRDAYLALLRTELAALSAEGDRAGPESPRYVARSARALATVIGDGGGANGRWRICAGQLHMTANRLGLSNPDEVYLSALLACAAHELPAADPAFWRGVWDRTPFATPLRDLVDPVLLARLLPPPHAVPSSPATALHAAA